MAQPTTTSEKVAAEVEARKGDMSERSLSEQTGIPLTTLRRYLAGTSPFKITDLERCGRVLGFTVAEITASAETAA